MGIFTSKKKLAEQVTTLLTLIEVQKLELSQLKHRCNNLQLELTYQKQRYREGLRSTSAPVFTDKEVRQLLSLCHPDKHGNSDTSNAITQKLLKLHQKA